MVSSHCKKRMNVKDDRLSNLSDDLIHKILSFIDIKDAIQTSALSSRWRFIWTSMPLLNFSREPCAGCSNFSEFVTRVFSNHKIQTDVHSVNLNFIRLRNHVFIKQILAYTMNLPALNTLSLHSIYFSGHENTAKWFSLLTSKCANLKNLTLKNCKMEATRDLTICIPLLSSLTLHDVFVDVKGLHIVAPQLKNLTMRYLFWLDLQCLSISAPDLVFFLYKCSNCLPLSTRNNFLSLEKADICVFCPTDAHQVLRLLQKLHNVKSLTLNFDIVELLSSSVELMSRQSSPFANLKSLNFNAVYGEKKRVKMSAEVKSYLLDSSPGANFAMVSREIKKAVRELRALLEHEKASIETRMAKMHEQGKAQVDIDSCWKHMSVQVKEGKEKVTSINSKLKEIKELLGELSASNRAIIQPSFSTLYSEADIVMKKIIDCIMMGWEKNQGCLSERFHELATTLLPSSY